MIFAIIFQEFKGQWRVHFERYAKKCNL